MPMEHDLPLSYDIPCEFDYSKFRMSSIVICGPLAINLINSIIAYIRGKLKEVRVEIIYNYFLKRRVFWDKNEDDKRISKQVPEVLRATSKDPNDQLLLRFLLLFARSVFVATVSRLAQRAEAKLVKYSDLR